MKGAYGFAIEGLDEAAPYLVDAPSDWDVVTVGQVPEKPADHPQLGDDEWEVALVDERSAQIHRNPPFIRFRGATPLETMSLLHPFLAAPISVLAHWQGMEPIHAGAFVAHDKAWLVIAERSGGKSTTLSALADRGTEVLSDDLSAIHKNSVMAGPRLIDLREPHDEAANLGFVGSRRRWRRRLGRVEPAYELGGYFNLIWGERIRVQELSTAERLLTLSKARSVQLQSMDPTEMLRCATKPAWQIARPPDRAGADEIAGLLLRVVESFV